MAGKSPPVASPTGGAGPGAAPLFAAGEIADFGDWAGEPLPLEQRDATFRAMATDVAGCVRCAELARCRNKTVFGEGSLTPRLVFMGEAPGADEDATGRPFVGRAGQLLTDIIEKGMKLRRQDVFILNTIKCRPPGNRNPTPEEAANCEPYLEGQLDVLRPEFICCLGAVAAQNLLKTKLAVGKLRGRLVPYRQARVLVTYHPSYLLRSPNMKAECWKDIQVLMQAMGLPTGKPA